MSGKLSWRNKIVTIFVIAFSFFLTQCVKEKGAAPKENGSNCDTTNNISFTGAVDSIVNLKCAVTGCHVSGGTGVGDFTTYAGLKAKVDDGTFRNRVLITKDMPSTSSGIVLSDCDLKILQAWFNKGAPN